MALALGAATIACFLTGVTLACSAERYPKYSDKVQTAGGILILVGLATLGMVGSFALIW